MLQKGQNVNSISIEVPTVVSRFLYEYGKLVSTICLLSTANCIMVVFGYMYFCIIFGNKLLYYVAKG